MASFRIPYPADPETRQTLFKRAAAAMARYGRYEGTPDRGLFEGKIPLGSFAGSYRFLPDTNELEVELTQKPWLVSTQMLEREMRKMLAQGGV